LDTVTFKNVGKVIVYMLNVFGGVGGGGNFLSVCTALKMKESNLEL